MLQAKINRCLDDFQCKTWNKINIFDVRGIEDKVSSITRKIYVIQSLAGNSWNLLIYFMKALNFFLGFLCFVFCIPLIMLNSCESKNSNPAFVERMKTK